MTGFARLALLAVIITALAAGTAPAETGVVAFYDAFGDIALSERSIPAGADPVRAVLEQLLAGPSDEDLAFALTTAIPPGVRLIRLQREDRRLTVELSPEILDGLDDARLARIFNQFRSTLFSFEDISDIHLQCDGRPLASYLPPAPDVRGHGEQAIVFPASGALAGKKITIGPSHGLYWNGSSWVYQRPETCGLGEAIREDLNSIRLMQFLHRYLTQDGATVYVPRQLNETVCCHSATGNNWWRLAARYWLQQLGLPSSVWDSSTTDINDDIRARPLYADYVGSNIYISHHTNAYNGTASGTEVYYDTAMEKPAHVANSLSLAQKAKNGIEAAIRAAYDSSWPIRNNGQPRDAAGAYGEIRIPNQPACLVELAFHDNCSKDAQYLVDPVFRSVTQWGLYKGICDYFGVTPTWDLRSYEVVSHNIPTLVKGGSSFTVSITLRNRGCVWNEQHQFRLGAVGNSDPLATVTRVTVPGNIGPAEMVTFQIPMNAPLTDLAYYTDWRMVQDRFGAWFGPTVAQVVSVDSSPPTSPGPVDDGGPVQASVTRIRASWRQSTDAKAGLAGYFYRVTEKDGPEVLGWTSAGVNTSVTIPLSLVPGRTYQVWVKAVDNFGWETAPVGSAGVTVAQLEPVRVGVAKMLADGEPVLLQPVVVSAVFGDHYYVQEMDRSSGLRVEGVAPAGPGHRVSLRGLMGSVGGERRLVDAEVVSSPVAGSVPVPVALSGRDLGGTALGPFTAGVSGGVGLNNVGLYVRVWGMVTEVSGTGFRLSDGSVSGGVWVESGTFHRPGVGEFAVVSGISSVRQPGMERQVKVSRDTDIWP
ncbi:MAG: N-acetylmuramoyl-L-alanine amidase [Armatimonadota bacterium]